MTQNQIAWVNYLENVRWHQSVEDETKRSNLSQENLTRIRDLERRRANLAQENISLLGLQEQRRHNYRVENVSYFDARERARANRARESYALAQLRSEEQRFARDQARRRSEMLFHDRWQAERNSIDSRELERKKRRDGYDRLIQNVQLPLGIISNMVKFIR